MTRLLACSWFCRSAGTNTSHLSFIFHQFGVRVSRLVLCAFQFLRLPKGKRDFALILQFFRHIKFSRFQEKETYLVVFVIRKLGQNVHLQKFRVAKFRPF